MEKVNKDQIQELGLKAIQDYFLIKPSEIDPKTIAVIHNKAKIGMQFEREMNLSTRAVEMNYIRVFKLVAEDKKELKALIKRSLPKYLS